MMKSTLVTKSQTFEVYDISALDMDTANNFPHTLPIHPVSAVISPLVTFAHNPAWRVQLHRGSFTITKGQVEGSGTGLPTITGTTKDAKPVVGVAGVTPLIRVTLRSVIL